MNEHLDSRAADLRAGFDPDGKRTICQPRPFMVELFGMPRAGKTMSIERIKKFFKRNGWAAASPPEGAQAEYIERPKRSPIYNFQTAEYALCLAREFSFNNRFHIVIFDRAIFDAAARMEYYCDEGVITPAERDTYQGYYLSRWNRGMFDAHVCLVCDPEASLVRDGVKPLTENQGSTVNSRDLPRLLAAHQHLWDRLGCGTDPSMSWHDTSRETLDKTVETCLGIILDSFGRRLESLKAAAK